MDRETVEEIKRYFGVVTDDLRSDVKAVAEGQSLTNERLDGVEERLGGLELRMDRLDQGMVRGFAEPGSMVRLSYAEIDRRFGALESEASDLRTRVERLESEGA